MKFSRVFALGAAAVFAGVFFSETAFRRELAERPVREEHYLAHEIFEPQQQPSSSQHMKPLPTIVFLHGWPDDVRLFRPFAQALVAKGYRSVNCNLPNFPVPPQFAGNPGTMPERTWGFTFDEAALGLKNTIRRTCSKDVASSVTLVTHDWGAIVGYLLHEKNPDGLIDRMIGMDVGWRVDGPPPHGLLGWLTYQGLLNVAFLLPPSIGSLINKILAVLLFRVVTDETANIVPLNNAMNWPYRSAWRDTLTGGPLRKMNSYVPKNIPFLFLWGEALPEHFRFADPAWAELVKKSLPGVSRSQSFKGSHWFLNADFPAVLETMDEWLRESEPHVKPNQ